MAKWEDRYVSPKFGPKLAEYEITNEDSDGYPYTEATFVFIDDIPQIYKDKFLRFVEENKIEICVERKETKISDEITEYSEKKSVNAVYWEKWYNVYR
jgi:hypothetical protein